MFKFKKFVPVVALSLALTLTACGNDNAAKDEEKKGTDDSKIENKVEEKEQIAGAPLQDGTYTLTEKDFDDHGWKVTFEITVNDGKITESKFDYVNEEGTIKSEDEAYQERMAEKTGVGPKDFVPQLNKQLVEKQAASSVEVVSGATSSSETFINYAQQLVQAAQKGDTTPIVIDTKADLKDGVYSLVEKNLDANGWKTTLSITVADGKITDVEFDYLDKDGNKKSENDAYQERMAEKTGVGPKDFVPALAKSLLETQDAAAVEVVTGATHSSHSFKMYAAQLINAAQKGDTTPIEVDNIVFAK